MTAPTSILTTADLVRDVAELLDIAWFGADGQNATLVPMNRHNLEKCLKYVNDGIRRFIQYSPKEGWRWRKRKMSITFSTDGSGGLNIDSDPARYQLDAGFGGQHYSPIGYAYNSNRGLQIKWRTPGQMRELRSNSTPSGYPNRASISSYTNGRWELTVYPNPSAADTIEFDYLVYFDKLVMVSGVATGGAATTLTDSTLANRFADDYFGGGTDNNGTIVIIDGTGEFETATITDYDGSSGIFTFTALSGASTPDDTSYYYALPKIDTHPAGHEFDEAIRQSCFAEVAAQNEDIQRTYLDEFLNLVVPQAHMLDGQSAPRTVGSQNNIVPYFWTRRESDVLVDNESP